MPGSHRLAPTSHQQNDSMRIAVWMKLALILCLLGLVVPAMACDALVGTCAVAKDGPPVLWIEPQGTGYVGSLYDHEQAAWASYQTPLKRLPRRQVARLGQT